MYIQIKCWCLKVLGSYYISSMSIVYSIGSISEVYSPRPMSLYTPRDLLLAAVYDVRCLYTASVDLCLGMKASRRNVNTLALLRASAAFVCKWFMGILSSIIIQCIVELFKKISDFMGLK